MDSDDESNSSNNDSKTEKIDKPSNSIQKDEIKMECIDDESSKSSVASEAPEKKMLHLRPIDELLSPRVKDNPKHIKQMQTIDLLSDDDDDDDDTIMVIPDVHPTSSSKSQKISSKRSGSDASSSKYPASSITKVSRVTIKRLPKNLQPLLQKHKLKEIVNEKEKVIASISGENTIDLKKRIQNEVKIHLNIAKEKCNPHACMINERNCKY